MMDVSFQDELPCERVLAAAANIEQVYVDGLAAAIAKGPQSALSFLSITEDARRSLPGSRGAFKRLRKALKAQIEQQMAEAQRAKEEAERRAARLAAILAEDEATSEPGTGPGQAE